LRFEEKVRNSLDTGNNESLIDYPGIGAEARLSAPTPDHYLPLLYILGARTKGDSVDFPVEGIDGGSVSMLAIEFYEQ
jgi:4,5-DOPA dioxygenase extradiol